MSEETNSSATASETEKPETTSTPSGKPGRNLGLIIAAIIVAILLVSTGLYFFVLSKPGLTVTITPSPAAVDAGATLELNVTVKSGGTTLTDKEAKLLWTVEPNGMGTFDYHTKSTVRLAAASTEQIGLLKCSVEYNGKKVDASATLTIRPPGLDRASVSPSEMWVRYNTSQVFTAKGTSTIGQSMTGLVFSWAANGLPSTAYTITPLNDTAVTFTAKAVAGNVTLNATTTYHATTKTGSAIAKVTEFLPTRTVDYRWYDLFNVPFGPWYPQRTIYYPGAGYEGVWSNTYPYIYQYYGDSAHQNLYLYSNLRLNITARNLPNVNMSHPEFLPMFGSTTGGHAVLNWQIQYMDPADVDHNYGPAASMYNDGFFVNLTGVTTLDKEAAMAVTGMTSTEFDNFDTYWATKGLTLRDVWQQWLIEGQANGVFDIYNMYGSTAQMIGFGLHGQKIGDKIVLTIYADTWGMEALMSRWLRDAFMPTEMYYEGFWMNATIGPQTSNIFITTAVEYGVYAFMSRNDSQPIWLWKPIHQDYYESSGEHPTSEFDPYVKNVNPDTGLPYSYKNWNPGSSLYGTDVAYDVTPCAWNLSANETMSFTWPAGMQQFEVHASAGHVTNVSKDMTISYAEPMPTDLSSTYLKNGSITLDTANRILEYSGPLDFWDWSKTQNATNHQELRQQWIDIHGVMLPESSPWVEFGMANPLAPPHIDHFVISGVEDMPIVSQQTGLTVTAYNQYNQVFDTYTGTVHFGSNRSSAVTLPGNYQFVAGDHGVHTFTNSLTFNAVGWFNVSATDTVNTSATGWYTDIMAIPTAPIIDHFTLQLPSTIIAMSRADVTVTAWNQYGRIFQQYTGTVNLTTNASVGTFMLPDNYTFLLSDRGVHRFQGGVTWDEAGVYFLTVVDTSVPTANGTRTDIEVTGGPKIIYKIYNMFQDHWMPFWVYRWPTYGTDIILSNQPGNYTMIYYWGGDESIWAPYRLNINASNLTNVNVRDPMLMPVLDTNITSQSPNSSATVDVYFQYLYWSWWNSTWLPKWSSDPDWYPNSMTQETTDGWYLGVFYNVTMNRETALQWLRLPLSVTSSNLQQWWLQNASSYKRSFKIWFLDQANNVSDIYNGYENKGTITGPYASISELPNGDVRLDMAFVSWGYEILTLRWLTKYGISPHQPYFENCTMSAKETNMKTNLTVDAVCQYAMKAVKANQSAGAGSAWAFEALRIDYVRSSPNHPHSDYDRYADLVYMSWNAGDEWFGQVGAQDAYETTPGWFNLTKDQTLTFELPHSDVIAYLGEGIRPTSITNITYGGYPYGIHSLFGDRATYSDYDAMARSGTMSLGFYITNLVPGVGAANQPLDLNSMYDPVNKTLTIKGPHNFDNSGRGAGNAMYHGAPWIEFNVTYPGSTAIINSAPAPTTPDHGSAGVSEPATVSEMMALMAVVSATLASIAAVAIGLRRGSRAE